MNDIKFAFRQLVKNPGFTGVAVLTLALGIGANTAIFSVVNGVLLRPLPYPEPERLFMIFESNPKEGWPKFSVAPPNFVDWRAQNQVFENFAAVNGANYSLTGQDKPERILGARVSASLFKVLGVLPALGREFTFEEDQHGRHLVAILASSVKRLPSTRKATPWSALCRKDSNFQTPTPNFGLPSHLIPTNSRIAAGTQ